MSSPDAVAAVVALLQADPHLSVYDHEPTADPETGKPPARPYVAVWGPPVPDAAVDTLSGRSGWFEDVVQTTIVGDTGDSVRIVGRRVRAALLDVVPDVAGRSSFPIRLDWTQPVRPDQDVQPPVLYAALGWLCSSTPA